MSYRKVLVKVEATITMLVDEGAEISEVISEMDYEFSDGTGSATFEDTEIIDHEIMDSR